LAQPGGARRQQRRHLADAMVVTPWIDAKDDGRMYR
jgi:hypothetical protein